MLEGLNRLTQRTSTSFDLLSGKLSPPTVCRLLFFLPFLIFVDFLVNLV